MSESVFEPIESHILPSSNAWPGVALVGVAWEPPWPRGPRPTYDGGWLGQLLPWPTSIQHQPAIKGPRSQLCGSQKRTSFWTSACDLNGSTISKSVFWFEMKTDIGRCVFKAFHRDPPTDRHDRKFAVQQDMRLFARASYFNHGGAQVSNCHET
jgi:hypothetical protein